jgi:eukaryotic translation initiation factor 2C
MQDAGITVLPDPISINGRILPTPSIYYGNTASSKPVVRPGCHEARCNNALILNPQVPRNGSWNVVNQTFHEPKTLKAWGVLNYSNVKAATIDRFVGTLINTCKNLGAVNHLPSIISD